MKAEINQQEVNLPTYLVGQIATQVANGTITTEQLIAFFEGRNPFEHPNFDCEVDTWIQFYQDVFNLHLDLAQVEIPCIEPVFSWRMIIAHTLTYELLHEVLTNTLTTCSKCEMQDFHNHIRVMQDDRSPRQRTYSFLIRNTIEADSVHRNKPVLSFQEQKLRGITLLERLVLELFFWYQNQKHLDLSGFTVCSGSRWDNNSVPLIGVGGVPDGPIRIGYCGLNTREESGAIREVWAA